MRARAFALARDARVSAHPSIIALSPAMDVVVIADRATGTLFAHRLDWAKLWTCALDRELGEPLCAAFRGDGKVLAIGYGRGVVTIHATEDGRELRRRGRSERAVGIDETMNVGDSGDRDGKGITAMVWAETSRAVLDGSMGGVRGGLATREGRSDGGGVQSGSKAESGEVGCLVDYFENTGKLSTIVLAREDGTLAMDVFGMFRTGTWRAASGSRSAVGLAVRDDLGFVDAVMRDGSSGSVSFTRLDASYVATHAREVYLMATHASHVTTMLEEAKTILDRAASKYSSGYRKPFCAKFNEFTQSLDMIEMGSSSMDARGELKERLAQVLMCETFDEALEHFFMTNFKSGLVKRMAKECDTALTNAHDGLIATLSPLIDGIMLQLRSIRGLARLAFGSEGIGISESKVDDLMKMCERLAFVVVDVTRLITDRAMQLRAFFVCIIRSQIIADGGDGHGAQLPAPRLDLARKFLDVAFEDKRGTSMDYLDHALAPRTDRVLKSSLEFLRASQSRTEAVSYMSDVSMSEVVPLREMLDYIIEYANDIISAPCALVSEKCVWMHAGDVTDGAMLSIFSNAQTVGAHRDSFHVDDLRDRVHLYRAFDGSCIRYATLTTPNELVVHVCAYKGGSIVLLLKPKDSAAGVKARLVLLEEDALDGIPRDGTNVDINSISSRERALPCVEPFAPLAVSVNRGLCAVLVTPTRLQVYDLEDDDDEDCDDDDDDNDA
ncbi:anaphase promoting complex subunit 4 [Ostreococcus tauri]|uniref:Anaphase-promoting complex subunit 4 n=1 Tax=Ostreococcus tauri TaxID=70448 RepID=A0A1Y5I0J0_OSTTA|nr:anaphase promoting complex subunit 4 [Ostreococcus tauri]